MRYMIAHMIPGEARDYHVNLSRALASAYRLRPVTAHIDPHLTIKAPFDALSTDLNDAVHVVQRFIASRTPFPYTLKNFGSFDDRVVYMNVEAGNELITLIEALKEELKQIPWLEFKPHEEETKPHATLCYPKDAAQAQEIVSRLSGRTGREFTCTFDTVALLKKGERRWEVVKEFHLDSSDSVLGYTE